MRKSFVTAISHELKSPLAAVMGQVEAMRYNVAPYDNHPKYLQESYQILEKMSQMIQEMLDVSKVDQTNYMIEKTSFSLTEMVEKIIYSKNGTTSSVSKSCFSSEGRCYSNSKLCLYRKSNRKYF